MKKNTKSWSAVTITGMGGSGSTLLFNIVREFIEATGVGVTTFLGDNQAKYRTPENPDTPRRGWVEMMKSHDICYALDTNTSKEELDNVYSNMYIINTRRDIRDCIASQVRRGNNLNVKNKKQIIELANSMIQNYNYAVKKQDIEWVYEEYKNSPYEYMVIFFENMFNISMNGIQKLDIKKIVDHCENIKNIDLPDEHITEQQTNHVNFRKTFMTKGHYTSNKGKVGTYHETLSSEILQLIEEEPLIYNWLKKHGYKS